MLHLKKKLVSLHEKLSRTKKRPPDSKELKKNIQDPVRDPLT
jgi:hypothetical protein